MKALAVLTLAISTALVSSGCGYRIVRNSDVTAKRFVADSATMHSLEQQLNALRLQCHSDSVRMANDLAAQRAATAAPPPPPAPPSDSLLKSRTAEIATLKDQLTKVSAELDRIKRRLANPRG
ncbi:MAG: hypothetical protein ABI229_11225 [Gemmatimonadaceae bacterium]